MKPKEVKAYICSQCHGLFPFIETAEKCCVCINCGGNAWNSMIGSFGNLERTCRECRNQKELSDAQQNLKYAQERLIEAENRLKKK